MPSIIPPNTLTVNSTSLSASSEAAWLVGTSHTKGERVLHTPAGSDWPHEFEAKQAHSGQEPILRGSEYWIDLGAENRYAMFDLISDKKSAAPAETIVLSITSPKRFDRLVFLGLKSVQRISVEVIYDGNVVFSESNNYVSTSGPVGWWSYLFGSSSKSYATTAIFDLPGNFLEPTVNITITGNLPSAGWCILGKFSDLGLTETSPEVNPKDYSRYDTNEFGVTTFAPRKVVDVIRTTIWVDTEDFNRVYALLRGNMNALSVFDMNNTFGDPIDALRAFGKLESVSAGISYNKTPIDIRVSGLN